MHICLFFRNQVQKSYNSTHSLIVYQSKRQNSSKRCRWMDFVFQHCIYEIKWNRLSHISHISMVELDKSAIFKKVLPFWVLFKCCIGNYLTIHKRPCIVSTLWRYYTFPASMPATNAPVKILISKHFTKTIPKILIFLKYFSFFSSAASTAIGFISKLNECHKTAE